MIVESKGNKLHGGRKIDKDFDREEEAVSLQGKRHSNKYDILRVKNFLIQQADACERMSELCKQYANDANNAHIECLR